MNSVQCRRNRVKCLMLLQIDHLPVSGDLYAEFKEADIHFPPTYKFDLRVDEDVYAKHRTPSYTVREVVTNSEREWSSAISADLLVDRIDDPFIKYICCSLCRFVVLIQWQKTRLCVSMTMSSIDILMNVNTRPFSDQRKSLTHSCRIYVVFNRSFLRIAFSTGTNQARRSNAHNINPSKVSSIPIISRSWLIFEWNSNQVFMRRFFSPRSILFWRRSASF